MSSQPHTDRVPMNPASRILAVYDKAMAYNVGSGVPFLQLWGSVLGIAEKAEPVDEDMITTSLMAFREEIELAKARLAETGCPSELYAGYFNAVKGIASATLLNRDWKGHKPSLQTDVRLALAWAAWTLPADENRISAEEVDALIAELDALAASLEQAELPPLTRAYVAKQLSLIRSALRLYAIQGIAPIENAWEQSLGSSTMAAGAGLAQELEGAGPEGKALLQRFAGVFNRVAEAAGGVDNIRKGAQALSSMGSTAYSAITKLLPPG